LSPRKKFEFDWIAQIHTFGYQFTSQKVKDHVESLRTFTQFAKKWEVTRINVHSGCDSWTLEEKIEFMKAALKIEEDEKMFIVHETNRSRILFNPWVTRDILKQLPQLKVNADLSHFTCVAERIFDEKYDTDWPEILELLSQSVHLVHARVGYAQGPQVEDPRAPEYQKEWNAHLSWWRAIWKGQMKRGLKVSYVEPEHGPTPYLHNIPYTQMPVANLWDVNTWIGKQIQEEFK